MLQDLAIHRTEIHGKLVAIMRERLMASLKAMPGIAATWSGGPPGARQPSNFAQTNAKQLRILSQAWGPLCFVFQPYNSALVCAKQLHNLNQAWVASLCQAPLLCNCCCCCAPGLLCMPPAVAFSICSEHYMLFDCLLES